MRHPWRRTRKKRHHHVNHHHHHQQHHHHHPQGGDRLSVRPDGPPLSIITINNSLIVTIVIITIAMLREVTASVYDLMGHPGGERERSEAAEQHITRRADLLFQVNNVEMMVNVCW